MPRTATFDREDLVMRAKDLFWARGWAGTSLKDLERVLRVKPGSFYAAFGSKDALYEEALTLYAADGHARLLALAEECGPLGALKAHVMSFADQTTSGPARSCMLVKTLLELQGRQDALATRACALLDRMEAQFEDLFRAAQDAGAIGTQHDPKSLARRFQSDLIGLRASCERPSVDAHELAQQISEDLDRL